MTCKEGDLVMCSVTKIEGATVFVKIDNDGEGSIVMSEIAAGRIRNLREYVFQHKRIVCKVLEVTKSNINLSLRRVTGKEREEVTNKAKTEQTFLTMLKQLVPNPKEVADKIKVDYDLAEFSDTLKENPKLIEKYIPKDKIALLTKMLSDKKEKAKIAQRKFTIKSNSETGLEDIKSILLSVKSDVHYLGASNFSISETGKDFKEVNQKLLASLEKIEKLAKEKKVILEIQEK